MGTVITCAVRTAVGSYLGSLKTLEPKYMGAQLMQQAIAKAGIKDTDLDEIIIGDVLSYTPNLARTAMLEAGFNRHIPAYTVDIQCASALRAVINAHQEITAGDADIVLAGGIESMSRAPYVLPYNLRYEGGRMGNLMIQDGNLNALYYPYACPKESGEDPATYKGLGMGITAENVAARYGITREDQDRFALDSQMKTKAAMEAGKFKDEIVPLEVPQKKGPAVIFDTDEYPKPNTTMETLAKLKPAFKKDGTVTAGNASGMNDGASCVILMSEEKAAEMGAKPLVKIVATGAAGVSPAYMGLGPVPAVHKALAKAGLKVEDIDLWELNEAFAAQSLGCLKELGLEPGTPGYEKVNVNGGAIAHGHALGNSGTRILVTLIHEMKRRGVKYGMATLCIGGGQGLAVLVENCD